MDLNSFLLLEVQGLASTINEYTRNHYIRNYTNLLIEFSKNDEIDKLGQIVIRLIDWYEIEIINMRKNEFLYNLKEHEKSFDLLKEVKTYIISID